MNHDPKGVTGQVFFLIHIIFFDTWGLVFDIRVDWVLDE